MLRLHFIRLTDLAFTVFYDEVQAHAKTLTENMMVSKLLCAQPTASHSNPQDPNDTSVAPPYALLDHVQVLKEILNVYQSFLNEDQEDDQSHELVRILDIMVDSAVNMCTVGASDKMAIRPVWDGRVFVLNCLTYIQVCTLWCTLCVWLMVKGF